LYDIEYYIRILFLELKKALKKDEVPVSAIIVDSKGKIIAKAYNKREKSYLTLNHAELICINKANKCMKNKILGTCCLFVTWEPCEMCKAVIKEARIKTVYYLLPRDNSKKQYSKTNFQNLNDYEQEKHKYKEILSNFFKKKR